MKVDVLVIGAGAAGLMCAIEAGKRRRQVLIIDHSNKPGKKILMSGGGRCNFTNMFTSSEHFISNNPHFCKSALSRYTPDDFIKLVEQHRIPYHEKKLGQLFCNQKSKEILNMLLSECSQTQVSIKLNTKVTKISRLDNGFFSAQTENDQIICESLVIATGGLSIPTLGASGFGYEIARQFAIKVWPTSAALVPFTMHQKDKDERSDLSGIAVPCIVKNEKINFRENMLFTHRGVSGPAILQISSYWNPGQSITLDLLPDEDLLCSLKALQKESPKTYLKSHLAEKLPKRLVNNFLAKFENQTLANTSLHDLRRICNLFENWRLKPSGTEGYRTAEVTLGGVDCDAISSKTMQVKTIPGLFFIGEVMDITGWLGGFNFQWAWSSGFTAGQFA